MISEPRLYFLVLGILCMMLAYGFAATGSRAIPGRPASLSVRIMLASALTVAGIALMLIGFFPQGPHTHLVVIGTVTTLIGVLLAAAAVCSIWHGRGLTLPLVCMSLSVPLVMIGALTFIAVAMPPGSEAGQVLATF